MIDLQRTEIDQLKNDKQKAEYENEKSKKDLEELKEDFGMSFLFIYFRIDKNCGKKSKQFLNEKLYCMQVK